jgi:hypothetical protein
MPSHDLTIDPGFAGMPGVAHGGYVAGLLTVALGASGSRVRLRRPVPTGRALHIEHAAGAQVELRDGAGLLADGAAADVLVRVPDAVSAGEAATATQRFADLAHPFPMCVCCGPDHAGGLHVFPGPVAGRAVVAAHWVPPERLAGDDGRLPRELVCAVLDCTQLWALMVHAPPATSDRVVTATLETRLDAPVTAGEPYLVLGWPIGRDGRRWLAGAAILAADGAVCAAGHQTAAVVTGLGVPLGRDHWAAASVAAL